MLLRNESRVKYSLNISLVYDDERIVDIDVFESDKVEVTYRHNGHRKFGIGVIKDIKPYIVSKKWHFVKKESAIMTVDMSSDNEARVEKIDMLDILDIKKIYEEIVPEPDIQPEEPDTDIIQPVDPDIIK